MLSRVGLLRFYGALTEPEETTRAKSSEAMPAAMRAVVPEIEWRRRERESVCTALELAKGRIYGPDGAAGILGVKPTTLISRLNALGLREPPKRARRRKNRA
jgi:transcriptional regulator with GAF, ATPase, and Fis domain